jgi:hypothetical protein
VVVEGAALPVVASQVLTVAAASADDLGTVYYGSTAAARSDFAAETSALASDHGSAPTAWQAQRQSRDAWTIERAALADSLALLDEVHTAAGRSEWSLDANLGNLADELVALEDG